MNALEKPWSCCARCSGDLSIHCSRRSPLPSGTWPRNCGSYGKHGTIFSAKCSDRQSKAYFDELTFSIPPIRQLLSAITPIVSEGDSQSPRDVRALDFEA